MSVRRRPPHRGLTLTEMMAASVIIAVALIGLASTWILTTRVGEDTDLRGAAYECARMVLERARANGFNGYDSDAGAPIVTLSQPPAAGSPLAQHTATNWVSPNIAGTRFFNTDLQELSPGAYSEVVQGWPDPPANSRFAVRTTYAYTRADNVPTGRRDLRLLTIAVAVYLVDPQGNVVDPDGTPYAFLTTCLTEGGV